MSDIDSHLDRWQSAGVLDAEAAARIRAFEAQTATGAGQAKAPAQPPLAAARWQSMTALILGVILLASGVGLFVSAHWDELAPAARLALVLAGVCIFHLAAGLAQDRFRGFSTAMHGVGTISVGPAIALVGQIFNLQSHWPAAILLWALAALAGWFLLRDQVQQTLALLLIPAWIASEFSFYADPYIGQEIYIGRILVTWAALYFTFFANSQRKALRGILFAAAAAASIAGTILLLSGFSSYSATQTFLPFSTRICGWIAIAVIPLVIGAFHGHNGLKPVVVAVLYALVLPWCYNRKTITNTFGRYTSTYTYIEPNLIAHLLVSAFAVFLCAWGVRIASRALVNFGIVAFGISVVWFYFSDLYSAFGRSLGLIGLGVLFLAGGWVLEKTRRRILAHMTAKQIPAEAQ